MPYRVPGVGDPEQRPRARRGRLLTDRLHKVADARAANRPGAPTRPARRAEPVGDRKGRTREQRGELALASTGFDHRAHVTGGLAASTSETGRPGRRRCHSIREPASGRSRRHRVGAAAPGRRSSCSAGSRPAPAKSAEARRAGPRSSACRWPHRRRPPPLPRARQRQRECGGPPASGIAGSAQGGPSGTALNTPARSAAATGRSAPNPSASVTARSLRSIRLRWPSHSSQVPVAAVIRQDRGVGGQCGGALTALCGCAGDDGDPGRRTRPSQTVQSASRDVSCTIRSGAPGMPTITPRRKLVQLARLHQGGVDRLARDQPGRGQVEDGVQLVVDAHVQRRGVRSASTDRSRPSRWAGSARRRSSPADR